jgi:hypothetical protein
VDDLFKTRLPLLVVNTKSLTENMAIHRHCLPSENQAINVRAKGWALRKNRKVVRFSEKVKTYLRGMYHQLFVVLKQELWP